MLRKSCLCRIVFCLLAGLGSGYSGWAQDSNRDDNRGERYFREMDRDKDGTITEEEYNYVDGRLRDRLKEVGLAYRPGLTLEMFSKAGPKLDELRQKAREQEQKERESRGESSRGSSDRGGPPSRGKPKEKVRINVDLPATYTAVDKDQDGQIGLYEWERSKFAEFRALDRNGDGFLSPKELIAGPRAVATTTTPQPAATTPAAPAASTTPAVASPGKPAVAVSATKPAATQPTPTPPEDDRETKQAKVFFKGLDKNNDGTISQEEWSESRGVRVKFEQANVAPSLPLSEEEFVKEYRALEQKKSSAT
ncbi:MAG TPA: hypothetical protein VFG20_01645 [Planctomycetaceae bacterium]|nr:hypothetical protein [Planctomycetaceae bacterium]